VISGHNQRVKPVKKKRWCQPTGLGDTTFTPGKRIKKKVERGPRGKRKQKKIKRLLSILGQPKNKVGLRDKEKKRLKFRSLNK